MKKTSSILSKIALGISAIILIYLSVNAIHYTFNMNLYYYEGISFITEGPDSRLKNLIAVCLLFVVLFLLSKLLFIKAKDDFMRIKRVRILAGTFSFVVLVILIVFVTKTRFSVECDQYEVFVRALALADNDYSSVSDYYFQMYPQQMGLAFFESFFLKFTDNHLIFQILNSIFIAATLYLITSLACELFENPYIGFFTSAITFLCLPLYYYVSFVYGDVCMIFAYILISFCAVKWMKSKKMFYAVIFLLASLIIVPIRKNALVFLLALAIVFVLQSLYTKKFLPIILAVMIIVLPLLSAKGINSYYEAKGNTKIENPMPSINWIAMGLYEAVNENCSVGVYNMYNELTYFNAQRDTKLSAEISMNFIKERLAYFKENPAEGRYFFRFKILEQWLEPTFSSIDSTVGPHKYCWDEVKFSYDFHTLDTMNTIMNYLQSFVYIFSLLFVIYSLKHNEDPKYMITIVGFIGGFLFSIIWEASGRYVFPYFILLLPSAAAGVSKAWDLLILPFNKLRKRNNNEQLS